MRLEQILGRVILINQSSVEMVNFKSVTRKSKQNENLKAEYHALRQIITFIYEKNYENYILPHF